MATQDTAPTDPSIETPKTETTPQEGVSRRGFASMTAERRRQIAAMGGKAVDPSQRSFALDRELAREAGRKGGLAVPAEKRSYSTNPDLAQRSGRKGGRS